MVSSFSSTRQDVIEMDDVNHGSLARKSVDSSRGHKTEGSMSGSLSSELTDRDSSSNEFLRLNGNGLCGLLEGVPLSVKLALWVIVAFLGFTAIGVFLISLQSIEIGNVLESKRFQVLASNMGNLVNAIQIEREISNEYLATNATYTEINDKLLALLYKQHEESDLWISRIKGNIRRSNIIKDNEIETELNAMNKTYGLISLYRSQIPPRILTTTTAFFNYNTQVVAPMLNLLSKFVQLGGKDPTISSYVTMLRLLEAEYNIKSTGLIASVQKTMSINRIRGFVKFTAVRDDILNAWVSSTEKRFVEKYSSLISPKIVAGMKNRTEYALTSPTGMINYAIPDFDAGVWNQYCSEKINGSKLVVTELHESMKSAADSKLRKAIGLICGVFLVIIACTAISSFVFTTGAYTTIRPWYLLNMSQEAAVAKFVPKGMLRLLECDSIASAELGMYIEKRLIVLSFGMSNINRMIRNTSGIEVMKKMNDHMNDMDFTIRYFNGFVHKCDGIRTSAIFAEGTDCIKAALKIKKKIDDHNKNFKDRELNIGIGIHGSEMLFGTIGSTERMEGVIIGDHGTIADIIQKSMTELSSGILVTRSVFPGFDLKPPDDKDVGKRCIGFVRCRGLDDKDEEIDIYELFLTSSKKNTGIEVFEEAVKQYRLGNYSVAMVAFGKIVESNQNDTVSKVYLKKCAMQIHYCTISQELCSFEELMDNDLMMSKFKEFSSIELSVAIFDLWMVTREYKQVSEEARREYASRVYEKYLDANSEDCVHILNGLRENIRNKLADRTSLNRKLFDDVRLEIQVHIEGIMKRFKETKQFVDTFRSSGLLVENRDITSLCQ